MIDIEKMTHAAKQATQAELKRYVAMLCKDLADTRECCDDMRGAIQEAAEALIGDGDEFDPTSIGDALSRYVEPHLLRDLPMSVEADRQHLLASYQAEQSR